MASLENNAAEIFTTGTPEVDLIEDLRLRRWARENYVRLVTDRPKRWHPVVLDEMAKVDRGEVDLPPQYPV